MLDRRIWSLLLALSGVVAPLTAAGDDKACIVFVRGGLGTTGHLSGTGLDSLSSIFNGLTTPGNHGYAQLAALLAADGHTVEEIAEGRVDEPGPADILGALDSADVLVFASNNVPYEPAIREALRVWLCEGGAAVFMSDGDWGLDWGDAPTSDQSLLAPFDLVMNQDKGVYTLSRDAGDFVVNGVDMGGHPILSGPDGVVGTADDVNVFDGEGVSPITVTSLLDGVSPTILVNAKNDKRLNDSPSIGSVVPITPDDAALVVLEYGAGRLAAHFDRNTFHNANGSGTDLTRFDNAQYARNLFAWLASAPGTSYGAACSTTAALPALTLEGCPREGALIALNITDATAGALVILQVGASPADITLPSGCTVLVSDLLPLSLTFVADGGGAVSLPAVIPAGLAGIELFTQAWTLSPGVGLTSTTPGARLTFL